MVARPRPKTVPGAAPAPRRRGRPYRRSRRTQQLIVQLMRQAVSAHRRLSRRSLLALREFVRSNGYDEEENRKNMRKAVSGLTPDSSQEEEQPPPAPRGRRKVATATTACLRLDREQKAEKKLQQEQEQEPEQRRAPSEKRAPPKKELIRRKKEAKCCNPVGAKCC